MDQGKHIRIVAHRDLTPRYEIFKARNAGHVRWTYNYMLGPKERNPFADDPVVIGSQVHVKLFGLAPNCIQPPHMHDEDVIFAGISGRARFLEGPEGRPIGEASPLDCVYVPADCFYGSVNTGAEPFLAYVIRLPREKEFKAQYNIDFPRKSPTGAPRIQVPEVE